MRTKIVSAAAIALVMSAAAAQAHVTVQPDRAEAGSFARFVVRVPNERDNAATVKVEVELPEGLEVRFQPKAGWTRALSGRTVTWEGGRIEPGEFDEFGFSTRMPDQATTLVFPAVQTYSNGEVIRWIGPADAEEPAARVTVAAAEAHDDGDDDGGGGDDHDAHTAIVLGIVGIALGALALVVTVVRRRP